MKAVAISAFLGVLVAIPFLLGNRRATAVPQPAVSLKHRFDTNFRYDVDDFFTE